ncbi:MAG: hypothetical protein ABW125_19125 [Candidatus Thiodiazotropha lotti]
MKDCFVICPIGEDQSDIRKRSDQLLKYVLNPVLSVMGYNPIRADSMPKPGVITTQIINMIVESPLVIADLTGGNPNVFYELAIRHVTGKPYIQIIDKEEQIPFDVLGVRTIKLDLNDLDSVEKVKKELKRQIEEIKKGHKVDSPVSMALQETVFGSDGNALSVFLEKFWDIEDKLEHIDIVTSQIDVSSELEDILDYRLDKLTDDLVERLTHIIEQKATANNDN